MSPREQGPGKEGGGMRHGALAMIACCVPMVAILALIVFKVI